MERQGDEVHLSEEEGRGGSTPGIVRYILIISLALAIGALSAIWMVGAWNSPQGSHGAEVSNQAPPADNAH
jgi:hypothetical protein